jgi:acyl dehydratase
VAPGPGRVVTLTAPPSVWPVYLRALTGARSAGRGSGGSGGTESLRHHGFRLERVVPSVERMDRYREVVGGGAVDRLPLLYPHLLGFGLQLALMTQPGFPFPALGLVHVTNRVESTGPLPVGTALDVEVTVGEVRPHPRGRTVDLVTAVSRDGIQVWTGTSGYLHRERTGTGRSRSEPAPDPGGAEDVALHLSARRTLPADLGRRYAAVSGDRNPIHLYPLTAKAFGFPRAIAHGMWSAAAVALDLEPRMPDAVRYDVQLRRPVLLPGIVRLFTGMTTDGPVAELRGREDEATLHLSAQVTRLDPARPRP